MSWPAFGTWLSRLRRKCTRHLCQLLPWNMRLGSAPPSGVTQEVL
jgi:hypothetical protein